MALVVTARSPVEAPTARLGRTVPTRARLRGPFVSATVAYAIALVAESAARATGATQWFGLVTPIATALVLGAGLATWLTRRDDASVLLTVTLAGVFSAIRLVVVPLLATLGLTTLSAVLDQGIRWLVLGSLTWAAVHAVGGPRVDTPRAELFRRVAEVSAFVVFAVGLSGTLVRAIGAAWACQGVFPDCNGLGVLPFGRDPVADIQLYHRLLSYVALGLVVWLTIEVFRTQRSVSGLTTASVVLFGTTLVDAAVGGLSVSLGSALIGQIAHTAASAAIWCSAVALVAVAHRGGGRANAVAPPAVCNSLRGPKVAGAPFGIPHSSNERDFQGRPALEPSEWQYLARATAMRRVAAYIQLTKPRVMSLLLATTAAAMVIAARGMPELGILVATLAGGALMSGGAGAINHYVDRDIDPLMGRTAWRPIPSGVISPRAALIFGVGLAVIASIVFLVFVNPLACVLALLGLFGYVFIYTLWLKRSTPSNIVIGGAAGAIPPLVGWAAVTNELSSLTAWYLFAIIFFWTPPHFWALSLLIRKHYERAGVPMLPVVRGEQETRRQIVLYSVLLVVLTLVLSPFGMMGAIYFAAAILLGGLFVRDAVRLWREATPHAARRLYLYSMLYLFLLFAAMAVDRVVL